MTIPTELNKSIKQQRLGETQESYSQATLPYFWNELPEPITK